MELISFKFRQCWHEYRRLRSKLVHNYIHDIQSNGEACVLCFLKIMFAIFRSLDSDDFPHVLSVYPKNFKFAARN